MHDWIELESLHVVSDLHLGGRKGYQIFGSTAELTWLIDRVTAALPPGKGPTCSGQVARPGKSHP